MSLCPHNVNIKHRRCDMCEEIAEAEAVPSQPLRIEKDLRSLANLLVCTSTERAFVQLPSYEAKVDRFERIMREWVTPAHPQRSDGLHLNFPMGTKGQFKDKGAASASQRETQQHRLARLEAAEGLLRRHHYDAPDGFPCSCGKPIDDPIHIPRIEQ